MTTKVSTSLWMKMETHTMGRDRERRQKRRSVEAKVLQKKQFRQRIVRSKRREYGSRQISREELLSQEQIEMPIEEQTMESEEQSFDPPETKGT